MEETQPENRIETGRNPNGTWKKGFCPNPGGRSRNPLKDFSLKEFNSWDDEKKRKFLAEISPIDRWKMTEGNPRSETDIPPGGTLQTLFVKFLDGKSTNNKDAGDGDTGGI